MYDILLGFLRTLNDLLTAGIAITAFSLLLYALSFNLRDRVARSFAIILVCVVFIFLGEALSGVAQTSAQMEFWFKFQWLGIVFLPPAYLHISDAILATTGKPSRGRRRLLVRLSYLLSLLFLIGVPFSWLVGSLIIDQNQLPHLERTGLTWIFTAYYIALMIISWWNFWRAYQRTLASASRRRMRYLFAGALAPALGAFPYLLFGSALAARLPLLFWIIMIVVNLVFSFLLILMAYAVAFFGVPWPDRIVKRRLFKWLMRGPVTASTVLTITTLVRRTTERFGLDVSAILPAIMVGSILILEHLITLFAPIWERGLFSSKDRTEEELLQSLDERLLTRVDLQQFLEAVLAAVCDRLQTPAAFIATLGQGGLDLLVKVGEVHHLRMETFSPNLLTEVSQNGSSHGLFIWGEFWLAPLFDKGNGSENLLGLLGLYRNARDKLDEDQQEALDLLSGRAALALRDRMLQQQAFSSLEALAPQIDMIQQMRAAARFDGSGILTEHDLYLESADLSVWVKEALTHYWGGPKLTSSPLLDLKVVRQAMTEHEENATHALRAILHQAVEKVRPEGERKFTGEWILYNILEMKFLEGKKVREVAMRLAMSEADLYRKQRVALEAVANVIIEMEKQAKKEDQAITTNATRLVEPVN